MKTDALSKKLPVWIAVSAVIMVIGLVLFFVTGFNLSPQATDKKSVAIAYDSYITIDDKLVDEVENICNDVFSSTDLNVKYTYKSTVSGGGTLEFVFDSDTDSVALETAKDAIISSLESSSGELSNATYEGVVHVYASESMYKYIWRGAIAGAAAVLFAFVYVAIRYKLSMGAVVAVTAVHDVALVIALSLICRVSVSPYFMGILAFALVYSILNSCAVFSEMRKCLKDENVKQLPSEEAAAVMSSASRKVSLRIAVLTFAALAVLVLFTIFFSKGVFLSVIPAILSVAVSAYSSCIFVPALYTPFKVAADKRAEEKAKYDYDSKKNAGKNSSSSKKAGKSDKDDID